MPRTRALPQPMMVRVPYEHTVTFIKNMPHFCDFAVDGIK